jgi:hypothetical protein
VFIKFIYLAMSSFKVFLLIAVSSLVLVSSLEGVYKKGGMGMGMKSKGVIVDDDGGGVIPTGEPTEKPTGRPTGKVGKPTAKPVKVMMVNPTGKPTMWVVV